MTEAEKIAGIWVRNCDMHPFTNIAGRRWWARGNLEGVYFGPGSIPPEVNRADLWWHFPSQTASESACRSPVNTKPR